jgi:hypothetical protein
MDWKKVKENLSKYLIEHSHKLCTDYNSDFDQWEKDDEPYEWHIEDSLNGYTLLADCAYGKLALVEDISNDVQLGLSDIVYNKDLTVVGLGPYYTGKKCVLLMRPEKKEG